MKTYPYNEEQVKKILKTIKEFNHRKEIKERNLTIFSLCAYLGLRIKEATLIKKEHIDFQNNILHIPQKNSKTEGEEIYLNKKAKKILKKYIRNKKESKEGFLFTSKGKNVNHITLRLQFYEYLKRANMFIIKGKSKNGKNLYKYRIHDLRAYFCIKVLEGTPNLPMTKRKFLTRHKSEMTLEKYYIDKGIIPMQIQRQYMDNIF